MKRIPGEWRYFDEELNVPYPWYTKTTLEIISTWNLEGKRIFEYGVGDSTNWFYSKGAILDGVDDNIDWISKIGSNYKKFLRWKTFFHEYITTIADASEDREYLFDIVVIDGNWRDECTEYALKYLAPGGFLIIDNYKQASVQAEWPKTEKLIEGMTAGFHKEPEHEDWVTAIIYKPNNTKLR